MENSYKNDLTTPDGTRDLLFEETERLRRAEDIFSEMFRGAGFTEVITPGIEYYDLFSGNAARFPESSMYKLVDGGGRLLVLRPDSSLPIARLTSARLGGKLAAGEQQRLFYRQSVFRVNAKNSGHPDEIHQCGAEIIGGGPSAPADEFGADKLALVLAAKALSELGLPEFRLEIGDCGIFPALTRGFPPDITAKLHTLIQKKNYAELDCLLSELAVSPEKKAALASLPRLFGDLSTLDEARGIFSKLPDLSDKKSCMDALTRLSNLADAVLTEHPHVLINVDLAMVSGVDYYTGLVFKGYSDSYGKTLLSGGRYTAGSAPSVGFAVDCDAVATLSATSAKPRLIDGERLCIALTKGRLQRHIETALEKAGCDVTDLRNPGRRLIIPIGEHLCCVLAKADDVITYVEHGVCDLGVVGKDVITEHGGKFFEIADLGFGQCRFALAGKAGADFFSGHGVKTVATKYLSVAKHFFEQEKHMDVELIEIKGSVELAPLLGLSDAIVDIVETGETLKANGLEIIEEISRISARLIANPVSMKTHKAEINKFALDLQKDLL